VASEIRSDAAEVLAFVLACEATKAASMSVRISFVLDYKDQTSVARRPLRSRTYRAASV